MKVESKQARKKSASEGDGLLDQFFGHWHEFVEEHSIVSLCCWGSTLTVAFVLRCWQQPTKDSVLSAEDGRSANKPTNGLQC